MLKRSIVLFTFGVAAGLFGVSQTDAQPSKGPRGGADVKKLEEDLARLLDQVKDTQAKLARAKEAAGEKKGFEGKKGFQGKKDFEGKKDFFKGKDFFKKGKGFEGKKGSFGKGPFGKGPGKLDPATIKERYEFYKKLYDELPREKGKGKGEFKKGPPDFKGKGKGPEGKGKGKGPEGKAGGNIEARIDRLIRELEQLRGELKNSPGRKRDRDDEE